ncbi:RluA family pseudouridine synthase [Desulfovibrio oxamicus]|uniref:RluA family pseudouridine synthase n=1 Tax=Nitratidesulfovibrio oxamicus TaxID=32016 RepID=A0ABS0IZV2_9BACT|nr:RluA family pseudouridine synthase [Nitratidesulfovibrio oxamicus]MBG3875711.1 RluA family pseudouridine synthase [Nitratidesulfovibrio oxamicus]
MAEPLVVTAAEAGQKLVQYLQRRCGAPQSAIQRWVRTGQVRINGGRCKPFDRVAEGDVVRVPPFALAGGEGDPVVGRSAPDAGQEAVRNASANAGGGKERGSAPRPARGPRPLDPESGEGAACGPAAAGSAAAPGPRACGARPEFQASSLPVAGRAEGLLVLLKPAGLAVQPGTGHDDCVTARLAAQYAGADFLPTPAHRLDRDTSGLLLVATSYARLRALSDAFAAREGLVKEYLAWVAGRWPDEGALTLHDRLEKQGAPGRQKVRRVGGDAAASRVVVSGVHDAVRAESGTDAAHAGAGADAGRHAACTVTPLRRSDGASLLLVRLHTGRTHQIRVQLAERGHPIMGDRKYGGPACGQGMLLHAVRLTLPGGERFTALPDWAGRWLVDEGDLS